MAQSFLRVSIILLVVIAIEIAAVGFFPPKTHVALTETAQRVKLELYGLGVSVILFFLTTFIS